MSEPMPALLPAAPCAAAQGQWSYSVSVRALCEFTDKRGDLDRRFTPSATALEGIKGQQAVASRRGPDYETEISLETREGPLLVRGRADGYDPRRACLEEIKTIRGHPDEIPENRRWLHWAQLLTYGALFCRARGLHELALALVYVDVATGQETELRQVFGADELDKGFVARCEGFRGWAEQEAGHRVRRDAGLDALAFPQAPFRPGQRALAEAVYRTAASRSCLLAQAPTGIGKTAGTVFPLLRAMPRQGIDKIAFLTCKGTGRLTALDAFRRMRDAAPGRALRVLTMMAKDAACEHPDKACHPQSCPLAAGFYDRLPAARQDAVDHGWLDGASQRAVAQRHGLCPYYLGQELVRWADVVVGDVNHLFDMGGLLWSGVQAHEWQLATLVDEAHNLVDRARQMYSADMSLQRLRGAAADAPAAVRPALMALARCAARQVADAKAEYTVWTEVPDALLQALQTASSAMAEYFHRQPLALGPLLDFHFDLTRFVRLAEALGEHSLFDLQLQRDGPLLGGGGVLGAGSGQGEGVGEEDLDGEGDDHGGGREGEDVRGNGDGRRSPAKASAIFAIRNIVPGAFLRPRFRELHSATLFSATLAPPEYAIRLLGLPDDTQWIDVPPAFPPEHLVVQVADGLSTRYVHRDRSLARLVRLMAGQFDQHPGNYMAFFSSHDYLHKVASRLALERPDLPQWRQERSMGMDARQAFLERFREGGQGIGFAVLGGVFAEGIDLPGTRLVGAFIATLGLPPVSPVQDQFASRLEAIFGPDAGYADRVPALQKVVQAAGRVQRTPEDRGWVWLLDERYRREAVRSLLPAWWQIR